eukprot:s1243_g4.t1
MGFTVDDGARRVETLIVHTVLFVMYARITLMTFHAMDTGVLPSSRDVCAMWQWYHGKFDSFEHRLKGEVVLDLIDFFSSMSRFPWDIRAEINKMADPSVGGYCEGSELAPMSIKVALDLCERHPKSMIGFLVAFTALLLLPQLVYSTGALQKVLKNLDAADLVTVSEGEEEAEAEAAIEQSLLNFRKIQHMSRVFGGHIIDSQRRIKRIEKKLDALCAESTARSSSKDANGAKVPCSSSWEPPPFHAEPSQYSARVITSVDRAATVANGSEVSRYSLTRQDGLRISQAASASNGVLMNGRTMPLVTPPSPAYSVPYTPLLRQ